MNNMNVKYLESLSFSEWKSATKSKNAKYIGEYVIGFFIDF